MKVIYVIGHFRAPHHWGILQNVLRAERLGLMVAELGAMPLVPHKNTENYNGVLPDEFLLEGTKELMRRCDAAITTEATGYAWRDSVGSCGEVKEMLRLGRPVFHSLSDLRVWLDTFDPSGLVVLHP